MTAPLTIRRLRRRMLSLSDPDGRPCPPMRLRPTDPPALCDMADRHSVLPAVLAGLDRLASQNNEIDATLEPARRRRRQRITGCLLLRRQLVDIEAAMAERDLPMMVVKGPTFADRLYPRPALRPFTDLDILVPSERFAETDTIMADLGYAPTDPDGRKYAETYGQRSWRPRWSPAGGSVEIHWNLVNSPRLREAVSVDYAALTAAGGTAPAGLLLTAVVHGATSHSFDRLGLLWDIAQAARGRAGAVDEARLTESVARTGSARAAAVGLHLAATVLDVPAAADLAGRLRLRVAPLDRALLTRATVWGERWALAKARQKGFRQRLKRT